VLLPLIDSHGVQSGGVYRDNHALRLSVHQLSEHVELFHCVSVYDRLKIVPDYRYGNPSKVSESNDKPRRAETKRLN